MDETDFDALTRSFGVPSRRALLAALGTALGAALFGDAAEETQATRRKRQHAKTRHRAADERVAAERRKKKNKKKKKKPAATVPPAAPPATPPDSPPPPPTGPGFCDVGPSTGSIGGYRRVAQTFLPPYGGQLTTAQVELQSNPDNYSLSFQIHNVDSAGVPGNTVLGTTVVHNIPETTGSDPPRQVTATFSTPAPVALGHLHALVVTGPPSDPSFGAYALRSNAGNPCPDGQAFIFNNLEWNFYPAPDHDMIYAVTITP